LAGDVAAANVVSPSQSLTQTCDANGAFSYTVAKAADGQYVFQVTQTNPLNQIVSPSASKIWTRDTLSPDAVLIVNPAQNPTTSRSGTFTFNGVCEANATVSMTATASQQSLTVAPENTTCSGSGAFSISQSLGADGAAQTDATYTYSFSQTDSAGNASQATTFVWVKDSTVPTTPVISTPSRNADGVFYTNKSTENTWPIISFSCSGTNPVTIVENGVELNTGNCSSGSYSYQTLAHSEGTFAYSIHQADSSTGTQSASASFTWVRDIVLPAAPTITTPASTAVTTPSILDIAGSCESGAFVHVLVDTSVDGTVSCVGGNFSYRLSRSTANIYKVKTHQVDPAGNTSLSSAETTWTLDPNSIPIPTVTFPVGGNITNKADMVNIVGLCQVGYHLSISAGSNTTLSSSEITNPAGAATQACAADGSFSFTIAKTNDGVHNFNISQQMIVGGASSAAVPVTWTRDTTRPTLTVAADDVNQYSANAVFTFSANEAVSSYQCSSDNVSFSVCTSPHVVALATATNPKTANGAAQTLYVRAFDIAQNESYIVSKAWTPVVNFASLLYHFDGTANNSSNYNAAVNSNLSLSGGSFSATVPSITSNTNSLNLASGQTASLTDNTILSTYLSTATIEFWYQNVSNGSVISTDVITHRSTATTGVSWFIRMEKSGNSFKLSFSASTAGTSPLQVSSTCKMSKNTWYHLAVTFDRGTVSLFQDGVKCGSGTIGVAGKSRLFDATANLVVGGGVSFLIDELRISQGLRWTGTFSKPTASYAAD
jgi:hypothetical protein